MFIAPKVSLRNVSVNVGGTDINLILNSEEVREMHAKYPQLKSTPLRKNKKVGHKSGPCVDVTEAYRQTLAEQRGQA